MSTQLRSGDLAGTTLDQVSVDWRNGIVLVTFLSPQTPPPALTATDFSNLDLPRAKAGASHRVKGVRYEEETVTIAMESGETLRITAARFDQR